MKQEFPTGGYSQSQSSEYSTFGTDAEFWACAAGIVDAEAVEVKAHSSSSGSRTSGFESFKTTSPGTSASPPIFDDKRFKRPLNETSPEPNASEKIRKKARTEASPQLKRPSKKLEEPFINLSPPSLVQGFINSRKLPYGVLWELARLISRGERSWSRLSEDEPPPVTISDLDNLRAKTNAEGVRKFLKVFHNDKGDNTFARLYEYERRATDPWPVLDKEEETLIPRCNTGELDPQRGRVHFLATLTLEKSSKTPKFELNAVKLGPSNSFSRHFGSKYFLRLSMSDNIVGQAHRLNILSYLQKPVILCQHVFRAFYLKDQHVYYFRTNEVWDSDKQTISPASSSSTGLSFMEFIQWHNPIELNQRQTMAKWASRFALGLSPSVLGFTLDEENINFIKDIRAFAKVLPEIKVVAFNERFVSLGSNANSDMTDGAGYITRHLLQKLTVQHDWPNRPSAIQVRVRGSKGLLVEDPDIKDESLGIKLRPSLMKIDYESPLDATHRTIDILRTAHARTPTRISTDVIINLYENGVKFESLRQLMKRSIDGIITPLLNWCLEDDDSSSLDNVKPSLALWVSYERAGSVIRSRRAREDAALARINGFSGDIPTSEGTQELNELEDVLEHSTDWFPDRVSGCPSSLEETIIEFLDSGFHPKTCPVLREKMHRVVQSTISRAIENYTIELPFSASAWIIPDPSERLGVDQVFFQCSRSLLSLDGTETDIITGDVLITRDPCRLPTDVQKWKAVDIPELHQYKDVIILSIQGPRRAADWLAGGDYDGDKAKLIWQPELVQDFVNADPSFADPPSNLNSKFEIENKQVHEFLAEVKGCSENVKVHEVQKYLLGTLKDFNLVGKYSNFHDISVYTNGYKSEGTKLLAYMFTSILDGRKTGKTVRRDVLQADSANFEARHLHWKEKYVSAGQLLSRGNTIKIKRNPDFIMERLSDYGQKLKEESMKFVEKQIERCPNERDSTLTEPYDEAVRRVKQLRTEKHDIAANMLEADLDLIEKHVRDIFDRHKGAHKDAAASAGSHFTSLPIGQRQDVLRKLSRDFHSKPEPSKFLLMSANDVERVKASYAYIYDWKQSHLPSRFPWNVAFRPLCVLKCGKDMKPVDRRFYDHMSVKLSRSAGHS